ncbi:MAG: hypothetical protein H7833_16075 [Magnetococcus sp. DMHC-1]|nr:hypothetical protein [Magnetococcales bacterium]MBF0154092.1 hypothetical protein [Magnetococcales bacterium]
MTISNVGKPVRMPVGADIERHSGTGSVAVTNLGKGVELAATLTIMSLFLAAPLQADLYTCKHNTTGETVWRNRPCPSNETLIHKEVQKPGQERPPANTSGTPANANPAAAIGMPANPNPVAQGGQATPPASTAQQDALLKNAGQQVASTIINDPHLMQKLMALQNNSTLRSILDDQDLLAKIQSGQGLAELANDPRIQKLMQHPMVQELKGRTSAP